MILALLLQRKIEVLCGGRRFELEQPENAGYHIEFNVPFNEKAEPDIAEIIIYNLSPATREIFAEGERIIVNAGYGSDVGTIFAGKVVATLNRMNGPDILTIIEAGDGASEYKNAYVSASFIPGTNASTIISRLLQGFGLSAGRVVLKNDIIYSNGKSVQGGLLAELKKIVADCESKIYTNNGLIYILPVGQGQEQVFVLNSASGLVDSPIINKDEEYDGYMVQMLLNPKVTIDSKVRIESKFVNGLYRVVKGRHIGEEFITEVVVVDAT